MNFTFHLGHLENRVSFNTVWRAKVDKKRELPKKRSELHPRLRRFSVPPMAALYQIALSLEKGRGIYDHIRALRNSIEHHTVVITNDSRSSNYFVEVSPEALRESALKLGRLARSYSKSNIYH